MTDSVFRRLATLTSVKRTRDYDRQRLERNGVGREDRAARAVAQIEANVEELKIELGLVDEAA